MLCFQTHADAVEESHSKSMAAPCDGGGVGVRSMSMFLCSGGEMSGTPMPTNGNGGRGGGGTTTCAAGGVAGTSGRAGAGSVTASGTLGKLSGSIGDAEDSFMMVPEIDRSIDIVGDTIPT